MEKDFGFGYNQHLLSPTLNLSGFPFMNGYPNTEPAHRYPHAVEDSTFGNLPLKPAYGFQQSKASEANKSQNWFYHKPHFQQAFPVLNSAATQMFPVGQSDGQQRSPMTGTILPSQKRFLVFDQSGDKTTLLYSSGIHTPIQFGACRVPNPPTTHNLSKEELRNSYYPLRPNLNDENIEDDLRDATEDEMHEDTEELDALLCSDDDDTDSSEDDETSTGHSPSTVTENGIPTLVEETGEEVDSFSVPNKRQKLLDGLDNVPSKRYAARSLKRFGCSESESDAESSCGSRSNQRNEESNPQPGCKRSKLQETVRILQSIIPDADGKDAVAVIDEAIDYLRSLKVKAKALGFDGI